eukprot:7910135-Alexandrium_andersonii.AAC.1
MGQTAPSGRGATAPADRLQAPNQTTIWRAASGPGATMWSRPHPPTGSLSQAPTTTDAPVAFARPGQSSP